MVTDDLLSDMSQAYAGEDLRNPLASPLYADYEGLPPLFLLVGERERHVWQTRRATPALM